MSHYDRALELYGDDITFLTNRAAVYFEMGRYDDAVADCDAALDKGRELRVDFKLLARALARKGNALVKLDRCAMEGGGRMRGAIVTRGSGCGDGTLTASARKRCRSRADCRCCSVHGAVRYAACVRSCFLSTQSALKPAPVPPCQAGGRHRGVQQEPDGAPHRRHAHAAAQDGEGAQGGGGAVHKGCWRGSGRAGTAPFILCSRSTVRLKRTATYLEGRES